MKGDDLRKRDKDGICRNIIYIIPLLVCFLLQLTDVNAQCNPRKEVFHKGEKINYDLYFKWGVLMPKAGQANFVMKESRLEGKKTWEYTMQFRTAGIFEKIYKMRDTIDCHFSPDMKIQYSSKRTNENNHYFVENITFIHRQNSVTNRTERYKKEDEGMVTRIDTTIITPGCKIFDMMGGVLYLRSIQWDNLKIGDEFPIKVAIGKDIVNVSFRYNGQAIVERNENLKYRTRHFYIDIYDEAFTQSKEAAEVWIGDDENHIPVKIRAKLKIGAAEVYYNSSENLKHPLTSRVQIPARCN